MTNLIIKLGMVMLRKLGPVIIVNALLVLLFIYSSYSLWSLVNGSTNTFFITSHWNPIGVTALHYDYYNGTIVQSLGIYFNYNFPYWLFFVSTAVNLYFIARFAKTKGRSRNFD